jgi:acetyl esterase/lipase
MAQFSGWFCGGHAGRVLFPTFAASGLAALCLLAPAAIATTARHTRPEPPQETGFLNRRVESHGVSYRFQVYLPEEWRRDDRRQWPIILFLHGRGERGSEGMWQTQIGLPMAVRDHPERWPFVIVMPQCPQGSYWTDPAMQAMALAALDQETEEFHGDPERTYLTGLSLGGYGAWELARQEPHRWAAIAVMAGGIFWSYDPERWQQAATLPGEYARAVGRTPVWLFHGMNDNLVPVREDELMYEALKAAGGHVRLWLYQGTLHDCWTRAYDDPELPRWLLSYRRMATPAASEASATAPSATAPQQNAAGEPPPAAERLVIPLHPPAIKLASAVLDSLAGEYRDSHGQIEATLFRQGDQLYLKNRAGEIVELAAESPAVFFYPNGSVNARLIVERDSQGHVVALVFHDDRHEERWERRVLASSR